MNGSFVPNFKVMNYFDMVQMNVAEARYIESVYREFLYNDGYYWAGHSLMYPRLWGKFEVYRRFPL